MPIQHVYSKVEIEEKIGTEDLIDGAVNAAKIANGAVGTNKIAVDAVDDTKIGQKHFQIGSVATTTDAAGAATETVSFPTEFPGTPSVMPISNSKADLHVTNESSSAVDLIVSDGGSKVSMTLYWAAGYVS